jgi:hypothetical protein
VSSRGWLLPACYACCLSASLVSLCGCSSTDRSGQAAEPDGQLLNVDQDFNVCPEFQGSIVLPQTIPLAQQAFVAVRAIDPDGDDSSLTYAWSATSGMLSDPTRAATHYDCRSAGAQILSVVTEDARNCHARLDIAVTCLAR